MAVDFVIGAMASAPASKQQLVISDIGRGYGQWAEWTVDSADSGQWSHAALTAACRAVAPCSNPNRPENRSNNYNYKLALALSITCTFN